MRSGAAVLLAAVALAVAVVLVAGAADDRAVVESVGLPAIREAAMLAPGDRICRRGIDVAAAFARVRVVTGTGGAPGPPLTIDVGGRTGRVPAGYRGGTVEARVGPVPAGGRVDVCVRNRGATPVVLLGSPPGVLAGDLADPDLRAAPAVVLVRDRPTSALSELPELVRRAALFKPVAPWLLWVLLGAVVVGLPALLAAALRAAARE